MSGLVWCLTLLTGCGLGASTAAPSEATRTGDGSTERQTQEAPRERCETYGSIQGIPDPGYCTPTPDMELAYQDCLEGANITARNWVAGSSNYWMMARESWNMSSPPLYPKNDETLWACLAAYQDVSDRLSGS